MEGMENKVVLVEGTGQVGIKKNCLWGNKGNNIVLKGTKDVTVEGNTVQDVKPSNLEEEDKKPAGILVEQSAGTLKENKVRTSHDGIKISSYKNKGFNQIEDNKVANVENNALEIDNRDSQATGTQVIDKFIAFNSGRGVYIKATSHIDVQNFQVGNNIQNINVEEEDKNVKLKKGSLIGMTPKMKQKFAEKNTTTIGMQVPMSDKFEVDELDIKGYDNNMTSLFKVNKKKDDKTREKDQEDKNIKDIIDDRNLNQE